MQDAHSLHEYNGYTKNVGYLNALLFARTFFNTWHTSSGSPAHSKGMAVAGQDIWITVRII
jgi:hypothetical protein